MKKLILILTLCLFSINLMAQAEEVDYSPVRISIFLSGGLTGAVVEDNIPGEYLSSYVTGTSDAWEDAESGAAAFEFGMNIQFFQSPRFAFLIGASYESKKFGVVWKSNTYSDVEDYEYYWKANFLTFSLGLRGYGSQRKLFFGGGAYYSLLQGDIEFEEKSDVAGTKISNEGKEDADITNNDYGVYIELGYSFPGEAANFDISAKFNYGLGKVLEDKDRTYMKSVSNFVLYVTAAISFDIQ